MSAESPAWLTIRYHSARPLRMVARRGGRGCSARRAARRSCGELAAPVAGELAVGFAVDGSVRRTPVAPTPTTPTFRTLIATLVRTVRRRSFGFVGFGQKIL